MNSMPVLISGSSNFQLSIDTSNESKYSDYTFNGFDTYVVQSFNLKRINLDLNWRYYFRIYYENEINNQIKLSKHFTTINKEELRVTALINLTNGTIFNSTCLIKTKYQTTTQNELTTVNNNQITSTQTNSSQSTLINSFNGSSSAIQTTTKIDSTTSDSMSILANSLSHFKEMLVRQSIWLAANFEI